MVPATVYPNCTSSAACGIPVGLQLPLTDQLPSAVAFQISVAAGTVCVAHNAAARMPRILGDALRFFIVWLRLTNRVACKGFFSAVFCFLFSFGFFFSFLLGV